nr:zinc finger CCHC domain-containing protein 9-like [Drosophila kikkawai]
MLLVTKLKGNAQRWLHANPTRMLESFDRLCEQLIIAFGETASKSELRRKFEQRKWQRNERFTMYFEEKVMMSQTINMDMEELLEQLIEGIPSASLRDQARIQRFANPEQMLLAFANVRLPQQAGVYAPKKSMSAAADVNNLRCRNCNSKGHFAKDCRKPARAPGSCFACGEMGHFVGECRLRKSNNSSNVNDYNVS